MTEVPMECPDRPMEIGASLKSLEWREWRLLAGAAIVILMLTVAVVSLSLPYLLKSDDPTFQLKLNQNVRGLIALTLLFDLYVIYQQILTNRLRRRANEEIEANIRLKVRAEEFRDLAMRDPLTGLYNRRLVDERLAEEIARSKRHGHPLAVLAIDLDDFKRINDRHGHTAGDMALKTLADRLKQAMRESDVAARVGGDEFLALLPECHPGQVDRVLARLAPLEIEFWEEKMTISLSAGWADYEPSDSPQHLLERADQALLANKRSRKNTAAT